MEEEKDYSGSLFPIVHKVSAKMLSDNLVPVQPMHGLTDEERSRIQEIKENIEIENRTIKIDSVLNDKDLKLKDYRDDPEYKEIQGKNPSGELFYLDFKYEDFK